MADDQATPGMSTPEKYQRPPLRYRKFGGGYRREDVEFALAEIRLTLRQLDTDLESLRERNRELESELAAAHGEIESFRVKEQELSGAVAAALRRAAEIEDVANSRAREIVAQAEEAAMRIRSEAVQRLEEASAQFNELLRLKDYLLTSMRNVVGDFDQLISRVERGEDPAAAGVSMPSFAPPAERPPPAVPQPAPEPVAVQPPVAPAAPPPEPAVAPIPLPPEPTVAPVVPPPPPDTASIPAAPLPAPEETVPPVEPEPQAAPTPGPEPAAAAPAAPAAPPPPPAPAWPEQPILASETEAEPEPVFESRVELDAGPFSDFVALSAFERALAHLPKVDDVYVRRLADDRARIELSLVEPVQLVQSMRETLPYSIEVRSADRTKLVVDVAAEQPAGAR